jgi:hypothetical protein
MAKQIFRGLVACLLLAGCGSSGTSKSDGPIRFSQEVGSTTSDDVATEVPPPPPPFDAGTSCDEDAMGVDYCIKNPGDNRGGGVKVTRLQVPLCNK